MAKTIIAQLVLALKDELSSKAEKAAKALKDVDKAAAAIGKSSKAEAAQLNVLTKSLQGAEKAAKELAKASSERTGWGSGFQRQIQRLRLSAGELEKVKASWRSLNKEIAGQNPALRTAAITRWRNETTAAISAVRAAQEQLTQETEKQATARAKAEAKALAATTKARARAAAEELKVAKKAAEQAKKDRKKADDEAYKASRTLADHENRDRAIIARNQARERDRAAQEQLRVARQTHQEEKRIAREAQREYRTQLRQKEGAAKTAGRAIRREMGYALGIVGGGYLVGQGLRYGAFTGAEAEREKARDYLSGFSAQDSARISAASLSASTATPSVSATALHGVVREGANTALGLQGSLDLAPDLARGLAVVQASKGIEQATASLNGFLRGLDTLGKNTSAQEIKELLNGIVKASGVVGLEFDPRDIFSTARRAKSGGAALSPRFITELLPPLIADLGPDQVGTALGSMVSQIVGGRGTKASTAEQKKFGLRDDKGKFKDAALLLSDPDLYIWTKMMPALQKGGVNIDNPDEVIEVTSKLFSNQRVADLFARMIIQREQYGALIAKERGAPGLEAADEMAKRDPFVAMQGVIAQTQNLIAALTGPLMPTAIEMMNNLSKGIGELAVWATANPGVAKLLGATAVGLTGLAASLVLLSGILSAIGLARLGIGGLAAMMGGAAAGGAAGIAGGAVAAGGAGAAAAGGAAAGARGTGWLSKLLRGGGKALGWAGVGLTVYDFASWMQQGLSDAAKRQPETFRRSDAINAHVRAVQNPMNAIPSQAYSGKDFTLGSFGGFRSPDRAPDAGGFKGGDTWIARMNASLAQLPSAASGAVSLMKAVFDGANLTIKPTVDTSSIDAAAASAMRLKSALSSLSSISRGGAASAPAESASPAVPGRASGGNVYAGSLYQVNEFGQEFFSPGVDGTVSRGRGGSMRNTIHIHGAGDPQAVAERVVAAIDRKYRDLVGGLYADYGLDTA